MSILVVHKSISNKISLSPGYLEMLQYDDSNQQARQSSSFIILAFVYYYVFIILVFLVHWKQLSPFLSKPFTITILF